MPLPPPSLCVCVCSKVAPVDALCGAFADALAGAATAAGGSAGPAALAAHCAEAAGAAKAGLLWALEGCARAHATQDAAWGILRALYCIYL